MSSQSTRRPQVWIRQGILLLALLGTVTAVRADRILLSPQGETLFPDHIQVQTLISPYRHNENMSWLQISSPVGIELEFQRLDLYGDYKKRHAFNLQYPITPDLGNAPSLSLGMRDILGTGLERQSVFAVAGKSLRLSDRQARFWSEIRISLGYGTGSMNGLFGGIQGRTRSGLDLSLEIYRQRPNVGLGITLVRNLRVNTCSLDGTIYYGLTYSLSH